MSTSSLQLPVPWIGVLPINAYVLMAEEPVLIDTGLGIDRSSSTRSRPSSTLRP